jgi:hypothetical protein
MQARQEPQITMGDLANGREPLIEMHLAETALEFQSRDKQKHTTNWKRQTSRYGLAY